ncbi:MAG: hypothetical protein V2A71_07505 [Candidatus Eisenbacteria bacterium]
MRPGNRSSAEPRPTGLGLASLRRLPSELRLPKLRLLAEFRSSSGNSGKLLALGLLLWIACPHSQCLAAFEGVIRDARATSMGECWSVSDATPLSLVGLPAGDEPASAGFSYCAPYGLEELAQKNATLGFSRRRVRVAVGLLDRGGSVYNERALCTSIDYQAIPSVRVSLSPVVYSLSAALSPRTTFWGLSAGVRSRVVTMLEACVGLGNFVSDAPGESVRPQIVCGLTVSPAPSVTGACEVHRSPGKPASFHAGLELETVKGAWLRCGVQTVPLKLSMGLGLKIGRLSLETASSFHSVLGRTDVLSLSWGRGVEWAR